MWSLIISILGFLAVAGLVIILLVALYFQLQRIKVRRKEKAYKARQYQGANSYGSEYWH